MQIAGVICEYNPFHTGHEWQLAELRRRGAEAVICCMSGNYVQRGDFAIVRKHIRAEAAVRGGADLVLELPLPWATASAEAFARGGVEVLAGTGVADTLAFGSECADTEKLKRVAETLASEGFETALKAELAAGDSFAAARQRTAEAFCGEAAAVLGQPNDILGVEYCKALRGTDLAPLALPRVGTPHDGGSAGEYASASYIRSHLAQGAERLMAPAMLRLYEQEAEAGRAPVRMETVERAVLAQLRTMREEDFAACDEGKEGLYHRFYHARGAATTEMLLDAVKTKRYARARLRRMMLSMYLGIEPSDRAEQVPYIRVLAMNDRGEDLLHEMRGKASLPVLIKPADVRKLSADAQRLMALEARATDLYALAYPDLRQSTGGAEWTTGPVIIEEKERRE